MLLAVFMAVAVALGWLLAGTASPSHANRARDARRRRWVERHPGEVNSGDVERELRAAGLSVADVRLVSDKAVELRMKPFTTWMFLRTYGARDLAIAVAGDLSHEAMLEHLGAGTVPPFTQLEVLARFNGLEAAGSPVQRKLVPTTTVAATGSRTLADLRVTEPGGGIPRPDDNPDAPRHLPEGWDSFFDDVVA